MKVTWIQRQPESSKWNYEDVAKGENALEIE